MISPQTNSKLIVAAPEREKNALIAIPLFKNAEGYDYRLTDQSPGKNAAVVVEGFSLNTSGKADMGAFDHAALRFLPHRPIPLTADQYKVTLTADLQKNESSTEKIKVQVDPAQNWEKKFKILKK